MPSVRAFVNDALGVAHDDVLVACAELDVMLGAGDGAGAGAVEDHLDGGDILARDFEGVDEAGAGDDGGAVLIVVEDRDAHGLLELFLNVEALRGLDVFKVDAAEGGFEDLARADDLLGVGGSELDVEDVDIGEAFEQDALAFHDGLTGEGADVAEAQDGAAVADDGHQVALGGVLIGEGGIALDFLARDGHAGGIGEAEVALRVARLGGGDGHLSGGRGRVVIEHVFGADSIGHTA